jgi:type I restriction enzyme S subunit
LELYLTIEVLSSQTQLFAKKESKLIYVGKYDILMVMDGASSGDVYFGKKGIVGSTISKMDVDEKFREIIFHYIKFLEKEIKKNNTGSAIPHVDKGFILNLEFIIPKDFSKLDSIFKQIREKIIVNNEEINRLTNLRDILLPKLMSGEINVSEIEI